jgi:hypothetical protein
MHIQLLTAAATMDLDARTKETAATLLGVATDYRPKEAPDSADSRQHGWETSTSTIRPPTSSSNNNSNSNNRHHSPAFATAAPNAPTFQPNFPATQPYATMAAPTPAPEDASASTVLSMSSIGFGIDSSASASWGDATDAAVRALQDAMERSTLRLPMVSSSQNLQIKVQIGVPPKQVGTCDPMVVDTARLTSILPRAIPVLPIRIVVGGLFLPGQTQEMPSICTAIACITLSSQQTIMPSHAHAPASAPAQAVAATSPWASLEHSQQLRHAHPPIPTTSVEANISPHATDAPASAVVNNVLQYNSNANVHRSTSIEMLAMISAEMRSAGEQQVQQPSANYFPPTKQSSSMDPYNEGASQGTNDSNEDMDGVNGGNYNYKKLPPGTTTKNNRRLFVKHSYQDHSVEHALPEEQDLIPNNGLTTSAARTPNAAFPLKLHETLTQIETNGHGDIIGWMPHGRSFKIHKQKEFAEIILPRYFVMTKKSSFLRQLNLYGFNRFSAGQDQGSYYHEKFLRGLKFLCRRMTRQKVNGNRIRSAGNPDDEPILSLYPVCPPPLGVGNASVGNDGSGIVPSASSSLNNDSPPLSSSPPNKRFAYVTKEEDADDDEETDDENNDQGDEGADDADEDGNNAALHRNNGGFQVSFPLKLQRMLDKLESERQKTDSNIISWLSHGRAFLVYNPEAFVEQLMPIYFNQTKYSSFQRQLHMYNFQRITAGRDKGAYHHAHFQRGRPHLCARMIRTRVNGKGCRKPGNPNNEPNLYSLEPLSPIPPGTSIEVPDGNSEGGDESDSAGSCS